MTIFQLEKNKSTLLVRKTTGARPWPISSLRQWRLVKEVKEYLLEKRRPAVLVLGRKGVCPQPCSSFPQWRVVDVVKAYLLEQRRPAFLLLTGFATSLLIFLAKIIESKLNQTLQS